MSVNYRKVQNMMKGTKNYNKWYGKAVVLGKVSTKDLSEEISHATTVTRADVLAVLTEMSDALKRHLLNSQKVSLDGIGTFRVSIKTSMADEKDDFNASKIKGYRIIYTPETTFTPSGELSEKGHRKGVFVKTLLSGITAQELPSGSSKKATESTENGSTSTTEG